MRIPVKSIIFFDKLLFPLFKISRIFFESSNVEFRKGKKYFLLKFFGIGSIVRIAYYFRFFPDKKFTLVTFLKNKTICDELEIDALYIRTNIFATIDIASIFVKIWKTKSCELIDFERSSNFSGLFRLIAGKNKLCSSFNFDHSNGRIKNQRTITLKNKAFHNAMEELFELKIVETKTRKTISSSFTIIVNVNAGDYMPERKYPLKHFATLIEQLSIKYKITLTGTQNEIGYTTELSNILNEKQVAHENLTGKLNLKEFIYELKKCKLLITNDSGPLHLAKYFDVATLGIWGPTSAKQVAYKSSFNTRNISSNYSCSPCFIEPKSSVAKICNGRIDCLKELSANKIVEEVEALLSSLEKKETYVN